MRFQKTFGYILNGYVVTSVDLPVNLMPNHSLILVPGGVNVIGEGSIQYVMLLERELFVTYKLISMLEVILLVTNFFQLRFSS